MEQDGDRKVGVLLQTVDELVKIAPELVPTAQRTQAVIILTSPEFIQTLLKQKNYLFRLKIMEIVKHI